MTLTPEMTDILIRLGVALAIGLFMGLERGWVSREEEEGGRVAGFRTFGLIALLGALAAILFESLGAAVVVVFVLLVGIGAALAHWRRFQRTQDLGITTFVAELIAAALGVLAGFGAVFPAAIVGVVVTLLLGIKPEMHRLLGRIDRRELMATLRLLLISVVLLPVLPDKGYGPWQAFNPYALWWMVVIIAALSYIGYFAIRITGERRGILLTGLFGGLASSTATTVNLARLGRRRQQDHRVLVAGITVSAGMMFPRILVVVAAFAPGLVVPLAWAMLPAGLAAIAVGAGIAFTRRHSTVQETEPLLPRNPLELKVALQFGLLLAAIMFLARALQATVGETGLFALAAVSGLGDVDAITLSFASMTGEGTITAATAVGATLVAALVNTAVKPALVAGIAGLAMARRITLALVPAFLAAGGGYWLGLMETPLMAGN